MKFFKLVLLTTIAFLLSISLYSQVDSTLIPVVKPIISAAEAKWAWLAGVFAFLWLLSEALAAIPSVKANSVFQMIKGWLGIAKNPNA